MRGPVWLSREFRYQNRVELQKKHHHDAVICKVMEKTLSKKKNPFVHIAVSSCRENLPVLIPSLELKDRGSVSFSEARLGKMGLTERWRRITLARCAVNITAVFVWCVSVMMGGCNSSWMMATRRRGQTGGSNHLLLCNVGRDWSVLKRRPEVWIDWRCLQEKKGAPVWLKVRHRSVFCSVHNLLSHVGEPKISVFKSVVH